MKKVSHLLFLSLLSISVASSRDNRVSNLPKGYNGLVVTFVDGKFNLSEPSPFVPNCPPQAFQCDGTFFWDNIARMNPAPFQESARRYMKREWGLDVEALLADEAIFESNIYFDPRTNYRAHVVSGFNVHRKGWQLHDQAYFYVLLKETTLSGDFASGISVPAGTAFAFGQYWIQQSFLRDGKVINTEKFIKLFYESRVPIPPLTSAPSVFLCTITESPWGSGVAALSVFTENVGFPADTSFLRGVITLDGREGLGRFAGVFNV